MKNLLTTPRKKSGHQDYRKYYYLSCKFEKALKNYAITHKENNAIYTTALKLLSEIDNHAFYNAEYLADVTKWFNHGSTLLLINLLEKTSYNSNNLIHFNAMTMLDTVTLINHK